MSTSDASLAALIKLLADDHTEVVEAARAKLVELGERAVPVLQEAADRHTDHKVRIEARGVLERIRLANMREEWQQVADIADERLNLEEGALLMARVSYPDLDPKVYQQRLDELAKRMQPKLKALSSFPGRLRAMSRFLFREQGFKGDWNDYFNPQNSYLNCVLDRKLGIPISLSVLYMLLAWRLKIPVQGVGIPGHFMVKYQDAKTELYVDTFNEGRFLSRPECIQFIVEAGYPYQREFLEGVTSREILGRMLRNLILIYVERREEILGRTLTRFLDVLYPGEGDVAMPELPASEDEPEEEDPQAGGPEPGEPEQ